MYLFRHVLTEPTYALCAYDGVHRLGIRTMKFDVH